MSQSFPWDNDPMSSSAKERSTEASTEKTVEDTGTNVATRPARVRKANAEATKAELEIANAEEDRKAGETAKDVKRFQLTGEMRDLLANIRQARDAVGFWSTGPGGQVTQSVWGGQSANLKSALTAIRSPIVKRAMEQARASSKVGASGFGALSGRELNILESSIASLAQEQDAESLLKNLNRVETSFRRFMAYNEGYDPDAPDVPPEYGLRPTGDDGEPVKPAGGGIAPGTNEVDPALKGVDRTITDMIKAGRSEEQIRAWLDSVQPGLGGQVSNLGANIDYWRAGGEPSVSVQGEFKPATGVAKAIGDTASSAPGAYALGAADMLTGGYLDEMTGRPGVAKAAMETAAEEHPLADFGGRITAGALSQAGLGGLAARYGVKVAPLALDAAQGAVYGSGSADEGNRLEGAVTGAVLDPLFGAGIRGAGRVGGAVMRGVQDPYAQLLKKYNVPMTVGQIVGGGLKRAEDRLSSVPILGGAITDVRRSGHEAFNEALFRRAADQVDATTSGDIGQAGVRNLQDIVGQAYDDALGGVSLRPDTQLMMTTRGPSYQALTNVPEMGDEIAKDLDAIFLRHVDPNTGALSGRGMQALRQDLRDLRGGLLTSRQYSTRIKPHLDEIENAYMGMFQRQAPDNFEAYLKADNAFKHSNVLSEAVDYAPAGAQGVVTPAGVRQKSRQATRKFGGKAASARGDRPFEDLVQAGQARLTSEYPDSGTAGRLLLPILAASATGGGSYAASGGGNREGGEQGDGVRQNNAGMMALLGASAAALPYSRASQRALQAMLIGERPAMAKSLGDLTGKYAPHLSRGLAPYLAGSYVPEAPAPDVVATEMVLPKGKKPRYTGRESPEQMRGYALLSPEEEAALSGE